MVGGGVDCGLVLVVVLVLVVRVVLVVVVRVVRVVVEVEAFDFERDLKLYHVFHSLCVGSCISVGREGFGNVGVGLVVIVKVVLAVNNAVVVDSFISPCSIFLIAGNMC